MKFSKLICPLCGDGLESDSRILRCEAGHSYDVAREGYVNLLAGKAPSATQGDSAEMVTARRAFLGRGLYAPLAAEITEAMAAGWPGVVADFGCGEGYYLNEVLHTEGLEKVQAYGTDISKPAIAAAAKRYPGVQFAVADTNKMIPLAAGSVDAGMCVFAPRNASEFSRVVRPGGRLVVVIPGIGHLENLRGRFGLIGIEQDKQAKIQAALTQFELLEKRHLKSQIQLDSLALRELLEMTPNDRHLDDAARADIGAVGTISAAIEFEVLVFVKRS